jgi:hypothetical protein
MCLGIQICVFTSIFPNQALHTFLFSPIYATWPAPLILHDLIIRIIFGEEYKQWNYSL